MPPQFNMQNRRSTRGASSDLPILKPPPSTCASNLRRAVFSFQISFYGCASRNPRVAPNAAKTDRSNHVTSSAHFFLLASPSFSNTRGERNGGKGGRNERIGARKCQRPAPATKALACCTHKVYLAADRIRRATHPELARNVT